MLLSIKQMLLQCHPASAKRFEYLQRLIDPPHYNPEGTANPNPSHYNPDPDPNPNPPHYHPKTLTLTPSHDNPDTGPNPVHYNPKTLALTLTQSTTTPKAKLILT